MTVELNFLIPAPTTDPCEYVNVAHEHPDVLAMMKNHLADYWSVKKKSELDDIQGSVLLCWNRCSGCLVVSGTCSWVVNTPDNEDL